LFCINDFKPIFLLAQMKKLVTFLFLSACTLGTIKSQSLINYADPLIGTAPTKAASALRHSDPGTEETGQTIPAVGRPFGMTQWSPETRTTEFKCVAPYYYNDKYITGFRGSHWMDGGCTQDYGSATLMPFTTDRPDTLVHTPKSRFSHKNEISTPAYYRVMLDDYDIIAELTGSVRSGILHFTFTGKKNSYILIRVNSDKNEGKVRIDPDKYEITGYNPVRRIYQGYGESAGFQGYFVIRFDKPFHQADQLMTNQQIVVGFNREMDVKVKIGTSFTSIEAARKNLDNEIPGWDFELLKKQTETAWNKTLGKVQVKGGSEADLIKFYTALYHCYQLPRIVSDIEGTYQGFAQDTLIHKTDGFDYYDDFSMWDTYRALHPLMTILEPDRTLDMVKSLILKAEQGGWMPIFPAWGNYTAAMIGDHVSTTIADAYMKGIKAFDTEKAYKYMRQNAFDTPSVADYKDGKGRRALKSYLKYNYIPLEDGVPDAYHTNEQVSRTLEYAFDDYALSRFAEALGKTGDFNILKKRSENWKNVFDTQTGFVRARHSDGTWIDPFDPNSRPNYICEGSPFQYTWYVPHDIPGLIKAMGGSDIFISRLNEFFEKGDYWHGNETDQQAPYIFAMAGHPEKTQEWVTRLINEEYDSGPGGISGNEDCGQMSAWLAFSMMGFYPVCPASNEYIITTPAFDEVKIFLPNGKYFLISSINRNKNNNYIKVITKNGARYNNWFITHDDIVKGNRFTFQIDSKPPVR
jgi:predicted alpha-1,2-mannosidase